MTQDAQESLMKACLQASAILHALQVAAEFKFLDIRAKMLADMKEVEEMCDAALEKAEGTS